MTFDSLTPMFAPRPDYVRHDNGDMLKCMRVAIVLVVIMTGVIPVRAFGPQEGTRNSRTAVLKKFIQARARQIDPEADETTRFSFAFVDLNGDGKEEAIVHVTGRSWCGSGGCQLYILTPDGSSYRFVARIPAILPPIRVLHRTNHGWHNVSAILRDDATHVYEGELRFNGEKYPLDVRPLAGRVRGRIVVTGDQELPLFP